ncbi:MAG TPA: head GIN domain-containing protein [Polyangiaceae bacterium]
MNTRLSLSAVALVLSLSACHQDGTSGSGHLKTDTRDVANFSQVDFDAFGTLTVTQGATESLTIQADDNLLPQLTSKVANGKLSLGVEGNVRPSEGMRYTLVVKNLAELDVSGAGSVTVTGLKTDALRVRLSGAGSVKISGQAASENIALSGVGSFDGKDFATKTAKVAVSGAGSAEIRASDTLDANISGVGNLDYFGDPKVTKSISGVGAIAKK